MPAFQTKIRINKPVNQVYSSFINIEKMRDWLTGFKAVETLKGKPNEVGSQYKLTINENGKEIVIYEEVTALKENEEFAFTMDHDAMTSHSQVRFVPLNNHTTEILTSVEIQGKGLVWKMLVPTIISTIKKRQEDDLIKFKNMIETT